MTEHASNETAPDELHDECLKWRDRLADLADEATQEGFSVLVVVAGHDPLSTDSSLAYGYRGSYYEVIGAADAVLDRLKQCRE